MIHNVNEQNIEYPHVSDKPQYSNVRRALFTTKESAVVDKDKNENRNENTLDGRRIVDIAHVIAEARKLEHHECEGFEPGTLVFHEEIRTGLKSDLIFKCSNKECNVKRIVATEPSYESNKKNVNYSSVWGALSSGKGYSGLEDILGMMDIPMMAEKTFRKYHDQVGEHWLQTLTTTMAEAAREEWEHAREIGNMIGDIGRCTVVVDGGWSHRSYGHSYTAKSGVAVIVGHYSKKLLFLGIRNKYCSICAIAEHKGKELPNHVCYRNWHGSSPAIEADIIVEGFCKSEELYNLRFTKFIGDGDSSVHKRILEQVPYSASIFKVECTNHLVKRVKKQLYEYTARKGNKKLLTNVKITFICKYANKVITYNCNELEPSEDLLRFDLLQVIPHCFGNHENCRAEICSDVAEISENSLYHTFTTAIKIELDAILNLLSRNASSLIYNVTTNKAEEYMHLVSKFTGGKQVFYGRRNSYNIRCLGAGLQYHYGPQWNYKVWKAHDNKSPGKYVKQVVQRRVRKLKQHQKSQINTRRVKEYTKKTINTEYGSNCIKPDATVEEMYDLIDKLIRTLCVDMKKRDELEIKTRGQSKNECWLEERKHRLTASNFGEVCKRRATAGPLVEKILYVRAVQSTAIDWGNTREKIAREAYEKITGFKVQECGLFVCMKTNTGFLAASPDGLVGKDKIIEIKCPYTARNLTPKDAAIKIKKFCLVLDGDELHLKRNHNYYYQIQGQLFITERKECDFVLWTPEGIHIETIEFDEKFVQDMEAKLRQFYVAELAQEIVDSRRARSMPIRNMPKPRNT